MLDDTVYTVEPWQGVTVDECVIIIDGQMFYMDIESGELGGFVVIH